MVNKMLFFIATITTLLCLELPLKEANVVKPSPPVVIIENKKKLGDSVPWLVLKPLKSEKDDKWGKLLTDIENHLTLDYGNNYRFDDPNTHGHETTHGINSYIRNVLGKPGQNGFYCLDNKMLILNEPKCSISDIVIPESLRGSRYDLYLIKQQRDWNDAPLYIFDEWVAYINGADVDINQLDEGKEVTKSTDGNNAPLEFSMYGLGVAYAVEKKDPKFLKDNVAFKEFLAFNIKRSVDIKKRGNKYAKILQVFPDKSLDNFNKDNELKDFAIRYLGKDFVEEYLK